MSLSSSLLRHTNLQVSNFKLDSKAFIQHSSGLQTRHVGKAGQAASVVICLVPAICRACACVATLCLLCLFLWKGPVA